MIKKEVKIKSYWGVTVKNEYIVQGKDVLIVLLPGGRYTNMAPLFYYAYNISIQLGYDILALDYGFQKSNEDVEDIEFNDVTFNNMTKETKEAIIQCLKNKEYKKIIFIGKCVGTVVQNNLIEEFNEYEQKHIFITPWTNFIDGIINTDSLVIVGTNDPLLKKEYLERILNAQNVKTKLIQGANHDLEKNDYIEDLKILREVSESIHSFIKH